jgi:chemotaxis protein MotB
LKLSNIVLLLIVCLIVTGCAKKNLIAQKDRQIEELRMENEAFDVELTIQKKLNDTLKRDVENLRKKHEVWMVQLGSLTKITLDGAATFASASAELTGAAKEVIDQIWKVIQKYPDRWILIEGHADDRPIADKYKWKYRSNWELSSTRAHAVLHYILDKYEAEPERFRAIGCSAYWPVADNSTQEGRAKNRRVVITVGITMDFENHAVRGGE